MRKMIIATVAALALAGCGSVSSSTGSSPSKAHTSSSKAKAAEDAVTSIAPDAPAPSLESQLAAWFNDGGQHILADLSRDSTAISTAATDFDLDGMVTACTLLGVDVTTAQDYAPIPDAAAQSNWSKALDAFASGAQDCVRGGIATDADALASSGDSLTSAGDYLTKASDRLDSLGD